MPKKTITVEATFGSDFQEAPAMRVLEQALEAWASEVRGHHSDNRVTWRIDDAPSPPDSQRR
jgi:hypothetical protein